MGVLWFGDANALTSTHQKRGTETARNLRIIADGIAGILAQEWEKQEKPRFSCEQYVRALLPGRFGRMLGHLRYRSTNDNALEFENVQDFLEFVVETHPDEGMRAVAARAVTNNW